MLVKKKNYTRITITIELDEWEAKDLAMILERIKSKPRISKSEFSLREKTTGRRLLEALKR